MRSILPLTAAFLLLSLPTGPASEVARLAECPAPLVSESVFQASTLPGALLAGDVGRVLAASSAEVAAGLATVTCVDDTIYCLKDMTQPGCEICTMVSRNAMAVANCCDYPPQAGPLVGSSTMDCAPPTADCTSNDHFALGTVEVDVGGTTVYVDDRNFAFGGGTWIYVESNGEPGLQRGGQSALLGDLDAESCQESGNPDLLVA